MSNFWTFYIVTIVAINLVGCAVILHFNSKVPASEAKELDHGFDGITEYNTPLPRWWMWLFWSTIAFACVYLTLYPGLGKYTGMYQWTAAKQWNEEVNEAKKHYEPIFAGYYARSIEDLSKDPDALKVGKRLFLRNCAPCHSSDAKGGVGFPNITDGHWIHGGAPETIRKTITNGRVGVMPAMNVILGNEETIKQVAGYVVQMRGGKSDIPLTEVGENKFKMVCTACHGAGGRGNQAMGAPNLVKGSLLYGTKQNNIEQTLRMGRKSTMPAHKLLLSAEQIHLLTAFVYSLSTPAGN